MQSIASEDHRRKGHSWRGLEEELFGVLERC